MQHIYTFIISFIMIFISELGDKTQLLVLSFSSKTKNFNILLGIALGTFLSHGSAILFGSNISLIDNFYFKFYLNILTAISFIIFGILGFMNISFENKIERKKEIENERTKENNKKFSKVNSKNANNNLLFNLINSKLNYIIIIAISIFVGELGDKTFLASLNLGLQYPKYKISLIIGSILGMVLSNSFALFFGKYLLEKINPDTIKFISNLIFIIFGFIQLFYIFF